MSCELTACGLWGWTPATYTAPPVACKLQATGGAVYVAGVQPHNPHAIQICLWLLKMQLKCHLHSSFPVRTAYTLYGVGTELKELGVICQNCPWNFAQGLKFKTDFHSKISVCRHELGGGGFNPKPPAIPTLEVYTPSSYLTHPLLSGLQQR